MTDLEKLWMEAVTAIAILLGACVATWFAADAYYSHQYEALKASIIQQAKDSQKIEDDRARENETVSKEIDREARIQISDMAVVMADLSLRLKAANSRSLKVCTAPAGTVRPYLDPIGPAAPGTDRLPRKPIEATVGLSSGELKDILTIGIDSLKTELFWRDYARRTGQASP